MVFKKRGEMRRGREVHQLDLGYPESSLSLTAPERATGLRAGDRAPDGVLQGEDRERRRLFELFRGPHWTLIARDVAPSALPAAGPHLHVHLDQTYDMAEGDILLVAGKGHEQGQTIGNTVIPFDDVDVVRRLVGV